jgi:hypothetical protein
VPWAGAKLLPPGAGGGGGAPPPVGFLSVGSMFPNPNASQSRTASSNKFEKCAGCRALAWLGRAMRAARGSRGHVQGTRTGQSDQDCFNTGDGGMNQGSGMALEYGGQLTVGP